MKGRNCSVEVMGFVGRLQNVPLSSLPYPPPIFLLPLSPSPSPLQILPACYYIIPELSRNPPLPVSRLSGQPCRIQPLCS